MLKKILSLFAPKAKTPSMATYKYDGDQTYKNYLNLQISRTQEKSHTPSERDTTVKKIRIAKLAEYLDLSKLTSTLVIGCRNATELDLLESFGVKLVSAIDLISVDSRIHLCDMHDIKIATRHQYDLVYCSHALEHALDYTKVLQEIHRITKPTGAVFFEVPTKYTPSGSDLHDFEDTQRLGTLIAEVFGSITILYQEDLTLEKSLCGTCAARILFQPESSQ